MTITTPKPTWIRTSLAAGFSLLMLAGIADARTAAWNGQLRIFVDFKLRDDNGKFDARVRDGFTIENQYMDTLLRTSIRYDFGSEGIVELPGLFLSDSNKKSKIETYEGLEDDFNDVFPYLTWQAPTDSAGKKPEIEVTPATFTVVTPKGKIRVTNKFQKVKLGVTYKVEGTIGGVGEYAGRSFKGKFKVKYKGARNEL